MQLQELLKAAVAVEDQEPDGVNETMKMILTSEEDASAWL